MKSKSEVETAQIKTYLKKLYQDILDEMELFTFKHKKAESSPVSESFQRPFETLKSKSFFDKPLRKTQFSSRFSSLGKPLYSPSFIKENSKDSSHKEIGKKDQNSSKNFTYQEFVFDKPLPSSKEGFGEFKTEVKESTVNLSDLEKEGVKSHKKDHKEMIEESLSLMEEESLLTPLVGSFDEDSEKSLFDLLQQEKKEEVVSNNEVNLSQSELVKEEREENKDPFWEEMEKTFKEEEDKIPEELSIKDSKEIKEEVKKFSRMPFGLFSSDTGSLNWAGEIKWYLIAKKSREDFKKSLPKGFCLCDGLPIEKSQSRLKADSTQVVGKSPLWIEEYDKEHEVVGVMRIEES